MSDFYSIIEEAKKSFTKDKTSAITEALKSGQKVIVKTTLEKAKGQVIRFYHLEDGKKAYNDYCPNNAKIIEEALKQKGFTIKDKKDL